MDKSNLKDLWKGFKTGISDHAPAILIGTSAAAFIVTTILAVKATPNALEHIEAKKKELGKEKLTFKETIQACGKDYAAAGATAAIAIGTSIAGVVGFEKEHKATAGALALASMSEKTVEELHEAAQDVVGKTKASDIEAKVAEKHVQEDIQSGRCDYHPLEPGYMWFRDSITGQSFIAKPGDIDIAISNFNSQVAYNMFGSVPELIDEYQQLERDHMLVTPVLDDIGWNDKISWHPVPVNVYGHNMELAGVVTEIRYDAYPITRDKADVSRNL